jgi:Xaa-Pro dipeptidase
VEHQPYFTQTEYDQRLSKLRRLMAEKDMDVCLISSPENIFYLTGLSHMGFFAYHLLIVPLESKLALVCRAMEMVTVERLVVQPGRADFYGFADGEDPAHFTCDVLRQIGLASVRIAAEKSSIFLPPRILEGITAGLSLTAIADCSGLVDNLRQIKSAQELDYTRQAAKVTAAMMQTARETAAVGVSEQEIAAEVHRAMLLAGGTYPGFSPFIRATPTIGEEHRTWSSYRLQSGDALFVELAGCVNHYHAPMGRLIFLDQAPPGTADMANLCLEAFTAIVAAIQPGMTAAKVYQSWQDVVDSAGLSHYPRHHSG